MGDQVFDVWAVLAHGMVADTSDGPFVGIVEACSPLVVRLG
jgi:hypothetical protein